MGSNGPSKVVATPMSAKPTCTAMFVADATGVGGESAMTGTAAEAVSTRRSTSLLIARTGHLFEESEALQVDSRTTSSGSTMMVLESGEWFELAMRRNTVTAAISPMRRSGWRTVVRAGFWKAAL